MVKPFETQTYTSKMKDWNEKQVILWVGSSGGKWKG
jgi:hypothetical protein